MKILLKTKIILLLICLLSANFLWGSEKQKKPINLMFYTYLGINAPPTTHVIMPWIKQVEKLSKGRLKVNFYPSMTLGGKPSELYSQVKDGSVDIVLTIAGYNPGLFTRTEAFQLPEIHTNSSLKTSLAIKENFDLIKDDFKKVKPLLVSLAGPYQLQTNKRVTKLEDLKGLKLRIPSRTGSWYIQKLGADPVAMPLPDVAQAFAKNAIGGAILPLEIFPAFKFQNFIKYTVEVKGGGGFGGAIVLILMNKDRYNSLPKDLQKIIDKTSNSMIKLASESSTKYDNIGRDLQIKSGGEIITLSDKETKKFQDIAHKVTLQWIEDVKRKGIDGAKIIKAAKKSMGKD